MKPKTRKKDDPLSRLDAFFAETAMTEKQPGEVTISDLRERWGISNGAAICRIRKAVDAGVLTSRLGKVGNRTTRLYKPV